MILSGLGRLGRDADVRYTPDNKCVANLSLAYNYGMKDQEGKRPTQWISASLWGERAEKLATYLTKGTLLCVVMDDVHVQTYEKRDGGTGFDVRARIVNLEFAGGKKEDAPAEAKSEPKPAAKPSGKAGHFDDLEDDIPF